MAKQYSINNEYKNIKKIQQAKKVVIMLTTSLDPLDKEKAKSINEISEFRSKPLTSKTLKDILKSNFPSMFGHY